jgi:hypothetical protein
MNLLRFTALLFAALALGPALAHLLELPNKIDLTREDYLTIQQIYRGWALLGIVVFGALLSTLAYAIAARRRRGEFLPALIAFWTFTYPANQATANWTLLPDSWRMLRTQWEYSHAASAVLNLAAFVALAVAVLARSDTSRE